MGNPDGGWYDDTPPRVIHSSPSDMGTNVKAKRVVINFNEFIKIEDAQNKVIVSPPQLEMPEIKATGKRIIVDLLDSLKENTTYTIDFSDAITDNNEGNPMGNYTFSFSTGTQIDTFQVSGYVLNAENLEPVKGMMVGLYDDSTCVDSTFHKTPMIRVSRTNGSGQFTIKGVAMGNYRIFALKDADGDFVYGQKSEDIAFTHDIVTPSSMPDIRQDTIWMDSLRISSINRIPYTHFLPDDVTLLSFQVPQTDRYLIKTERKEPEKIGLFFSYGSDTLPRLRGLNFDADNAFFIEASEKRDTIYYWLRDTALVNQDTLRIEATYMATDTTGLLTEKTDTIEALPKVPYAKRLKEQEKAFEKWQKEQEKKKKRGERYDSIMPVKHLNVKLNTSGQLSPLSNVYLEMPVPLDSCLEDSIHLYSMIDSVWYNAPHLFEQVSPLTYIIKAEWRPGIEYSLEIDSAAFRSIYGEVSKPIKQGIKIRTEDEFSTLMVNIPNMPDSGDIIVQLLDGDKFVREVKVQDGTAEFYYVAPKKYYLRAYIDWNKNGEWDTGDYDADRQPEPVYYYHEEIECKAKWDVSRTWNLTERPLYRQKPGAITKQKPDQEKKLRDRNAQRAAEKGVPYVPKE
jgi:hypothetical protein